MFKPRQINLKSGRWLGLVVVWGSIISSYTAYAQETQPLINATFEGVVLDAVSQEPLTGATLQLAGVTHATKTDRQGHFRFVTGQKLPITVIVSYVGYVTREVAVNEPRVVISLERSG